MNRPGTTSLEAWANSSLIVISESIWSLASFSAEDEIVVQVV